LKYLAIISLLSLVSTAYAATPFFVNGGFTKNGVEWCEENYLLYQYMGNDFFEHHQHSIESRVCASLFSDSLWNYSGHDRSDKLIEKSRYYTQLEIEESRKEAETGKIDTNPASFQDDVSQEIIQQQKELENKSKEKMKLENETRGESKEIHNYTITDDINSDVNKEGGGCLIATAAYGSEMSPQIQFLREIRDDKVMTTELGRSFMNEFNQFYYSFSPSVADYERENPAFKEIVKVGITPMLLSLSILSAANSEQEILGLGIGIIVMNIGMYFVAPVVIIYKIKKISRINYS
jgi:hypothetical protein